MIDRLKKLPKTEKTLKILVSRGINSASHRKPDAKLTKKISSANSFTGLRICVEQEEL